MAVVRIKSTMKPPEDYMCGTTDEKGTWPTDCGDGSTMQVFNETTHALDHVEIFYNGNWNTTA